MSTYTVAGTVKVGTTGIVGATITVTRVSGTADASSPYSLTSSTGGIYSGGTLVTGTVYSIAASDGSLVFSTLPNFTVASADITGENFTLTPTISVAPTTVSFAGPDAQEALLVSTVGNDVAGTTTWLSSNTAVATVSATGLVTVVAAGTATITAEVTDDTAVTATCSITIGSAITVLLTAAHVNLLQSVLREQLQEGYASNPFTSSQSALIKSALAALGQAV